MSIGTSSTDNPLKISVGSGLLIQLEASTDYVVVKLDGKQPGSPLSIFGTIHVYLSGLYNTDMLRRATLSWTYAWNSKKSVLWFRLRDLNTQMSWCFNCNAKTYVLEQIKDSDFRRGLDLLAYKKPADEPSNTDSKTKGPFVSPLKAYHDVSKLRAQTAYYDFSIVCGDDHKIPVHSLVLKTYWPYFDSMMENDCQESSEKVLKLDYPKEWVEKLVSYVYGEVLDLTFDELTGLAYLGELYQLPEMVDMLAKEIMDIGPDMSLEEVILAWKRTFPVKNQSLKSRLTRLAFVKNKEREKSQAEESEGSISDLYDILTTQEAVGLFQATLSMTTLDDE